MPPAPDPPEKPPDHPPFPGRATLVSDHACSACVTGGSASTVRYLVHNGFSRGGLGRCVRFDGFWVLTLAVGSPTL